jgi:hypothetical protein
VAEGAAGPSSQSVTLLGGPRLRSRSPHRLAPRQAPPLRRDAPGRIARRRGSLPDLASQDERAAARTAFDSYVYAASTRRVLQIKGETVEKALAKWGVEPLPPTEEKVAALGATLKAGGYRSSSSYLSAYRGIIERAGYVIDGPLSRAFKDAVRACERGQWGPCSHYGLEVRSPRNSPGGHFTVVRGRPSMPPQRHHLRRMVHDTRN